MERDGRSLVRWVLVCFGLYRGLGAGAGAKGVRAPCCVVDRSRRAGGEFRVVRRAGGGRVLVVRLAAELRDGESGSRVFKLVLRLGLSERLEAERIAVGRILVTVSGIFLWLSRVGLSLSVLARGSFASLNGFDSLRILVVDARLIDGDSGVFDPDVVVVDSRGGLCDLVLSGGGNGEGDGLHNGGSYILAVLMLAGFVCAVCAGLDTSLLEIGGNTAVCNGNTGLGGNGNLRRCGDSVCNCRVLDWFCVIARLLVCLGFRSRSLVDSSGIVLRPLAVLVLLDLLGLLVITRLAKIRATKAEKAVSTEVLVLDLVDLLVHLVPSLGAVLLVVKAIAASRIGLAILTTQSGNSGIVNDSDLGMVDSDGLLDVCHCNLLEVVIVDDTGDVLILVPLVAGLTVRASCAAGGVGLVLRSNSHGCLP